MQLGGLGGRCKLPQQVWADPGRQTLSGHFHAEICTLLSLTKWRIRNFYCTFYCFKNDVRKFPWGRLEGIAPTTFWPWGRSPPMESAPMSYVTQCTVRCHRLMDVMPSHRCYRIPCCCCCCCGDRQQIFISVHLSLSHQANPLTDDKLLPRT